VGSWWRLRLTWTASQNVANNSSSVTAKLYWEAVKDGVGYVSSSSSRGASITINGDTDSFTTTAGLSAGGSRLIRTTTISIPHNADGTKSFSISGSLNLSGISLSGSDYGTQTVSGTATLNTIPRSST